ncbi:MULTISPECIES: hypothetical protein [Mesorhizobium]|uniref:hypothetical protein n=1 Tax=Mesorhizobium TaxID=68287 RepID=UPI002A23A67B|nr:MULTISPECIES: hypothetical protein [unclassified Mesorhizobium]MDX8448626.1 hypothetical protein [Mesorhizobium sp. VK3C]MDX8463972.1 hypothetical protein [Mesorhizobium sp. VK2D]
MKEQRRSQGDLFEPTTLPAELPLGMRRTLTPLLQLLLVEAAAQGTREENGDRIGEEDGNDQDYV